jgi:hypothetical protein
MQQRLAIPIKSPSMKAKIRTKSATFFEILRGPDTKKHRKLKKTVDMATGQKFRSKFGLIQSLYYYLGSTSSEFDLVV